MTDIEKAKEIYFAFLNTGKGFISKHLAKENSILHCQLMIAKLREHFLLHERFVMMSGFISARKLNFRN